MSVIYIFDETQSAVSTIYHHENEKKKTKKRSNSIDTTKNIIIKTYG